jgi:hypothetical protein
VFILLLVGLLLAASIQIAGTGEKTARRIGEIVLLYILVGYCGIPMLLVSAWNLASPDRAAAHFGFPPGGPFQEFAGVAFLGMSLASILALRYRGAYLVAPSVCWGVFFAGATFIHLKDAGHRGVLTHADMLHVFAAHGLISVLLAVSLLASGVLKKKA